MSQHRILSLKPTLRLEGEATIARIKQSNANIID
jgi:hypothetical protein